MGLDIEALRKKMEEVKDRQNRSGGADFWSPKEGRNVIRILPAKEGQEFYSEAKVRFNVGPKKKMVTVPLDSNPENCPIHAFVDELKNSGDKDDEKLAKRMGIRNRYYFNIIDRSVEEGEKGYGEVKVFGCGPTIFTDILGIIVDPDYGDITDPENGFDIIITKSGEGLNTEYRVNARPKQTPIGIEGWEEKLNDLQKIATPKSYESRLAILKGEDEKDDEGDEDTEKPQKEVKTSSISKVEKEPENPTDDFDDSEADDIEAEIQAMLNRHKK